MKIGELTTLTGVPERQIRYLITEKFIPPPRGGRAHAEYGDDHVAAIRRYSRMRELGFPPAAIKLLQQSGEGAPFPVAPGVTLVITPELIGCGAPIEPLAMRIVELLTDLLKDTSNAPNSSADHD